MAISSLHIMALSYYIMQKHPKLDPTHACLVVPKSSSSRSDHVTSSMLRAGVSSDQITPHARRVRFLPTPLRCRPRLMSIFLDSNSVLQTRQGIFRGDPAYPGVNHEALELPGASHIPLQGNRAALLGWCVFLSSFL